MIEKSKKILVERVRQSFGSSGRKLLIREAHVDDIPAIQGLFDRIYQGKYPLGFGSDNEILQGEIVDFQHYLWLVAEDQAQASGELVGTMMFTIDPDNRMAKAGGGTVTPEFRKHGLAARMLTLGVDYLVKTSEIVDVIYGTTRTASEGPSKMTAEAGFRKLGIFPNAVHIDGMEHLSLDVYLSEHAIERRRKKPFLYAPFNEIYGIARKQLGLEPAHRVTEREPLTLSRQKMQLQVHKDESRAIERFRYYVERDRIANRFFPFHMPNWMLSSEDGGTDVFVWYGGVGKQASILGFRTDRVNQHDLLDSVAIALQKEGAAYVELIVNAYDYIFQQEAFTAKFIPSAYFPAMRLASDKLRDDYFVVNRTFQILDFTSAFVPSESYSYLKAYMRFYDELYIKPLHKTELRKSQKPG